MDEHQLGVKANRAQQFLSSDEWREAFSSYREKLFAAIEKAEDPAHVMRLKGLLTAAHEAKAHLERLMNNGKIEAAELDAQEKQRGLLARLKIF